MLTLNCKGMQFVDQSQISTVQLCFYAGLIIA